MLKRSLTLLFLIFSLPSTLYAQEIVSIGVIGPLTGSLSALGAEQLNALRLAEQDINQQQILGAKKIRFIAEDGKCQGKDAATAAQKLTSIDKVVAILGGVCSGETLGAAPIAERSKTILISGFSSNHDISKAGDYIFRLSPDDNAGGVTLANHLLSKGVKRLAILSENTDYALGLDAATSAQLTSHGAQVVARENYNPEETNFKSSLLRLKAKSPDALFLNPQGAVLGGLMVKQLREMGWQIPLYGAYTFSSPEAAASAGGVLALEGISFIDIPIVTTESGKELLRRYKEKFGTIQSDFFITGTYDTALLVAKAIAAGSKSSEIREYFNSLSRYEGRCGTFHFDENGDVVGINYILKRITGGKVVLVE